MTARALTYVCTRPKVLVPALIGLGMLLGKMSAVWGLACLAFAAFQASRLLAHPDLDVRLRLRADKHSRGIRRLLSEAESLEVMAIDAYVATLRQTGADPALAQEVLDQMWRIIQDGGAQEQSTQLRLFRLRLPPLAGTEGTTKDSLQARLTRELNIVHATRKEVESLS